MRKERVLVILEWSPLGSTRVCGRGWIGKRKPEHSLYFIPSSKGA
jgi:hypothetical protein